MDKAEILVQIRRIAGENGGVAPGWRKVAAVSGIKYGDWCGVFWARWNDALHEAGFAPNRLTEAYDETVLLDYYAELVVGLDRLPTSTDLRMERRRNSQFPNERTFDRLGSKLELVKKLEVHCRGRSEKARVSVLASDYISKADAPIEPDETQGSSDYAEGFVYMIRLGKHFKVGHTSAVPRRHREISLELPEKPTIVHVIRTDDPEGIERYWHSRFASSRSNGEWFLLSVKDVQAFKRRKVM